MDDRGSVTPALALLVIGGLLLVGIGIDVGRLGATWREAAYAADVGAEAGASVIDQDAARKGTLAVAVGKAESVAVDMSLRTRPRSSRTAAATATADQICVQVEQSFRPSILRSIGARDTKIMLRSCASPAQG